LGIGQIYLDEKKMIEYPSLIQIETTSKCQASCIFCPHKNLKRPLRDMDIDLFKKIIEDCKSFHLTNICPFLNGELFMDKLWFQRLKFINETLPKIKIDIFSNMGALDAEKLEKFSEISNLQHFVMSINGYDEKTCRQRTGLNWSLVHANVLRLVDLNLNKRFIEHLSLSGLDFGPDENIKFLEKWSRLQGLDAMGASSMNNWKGDALGARITREIKYDIICPRSHHLCIIADGRVSLCCMDSNCDFEMGDLKKQNILEVFNGEKYKKYRTLKKQDLVPCNKCSME